MTSRSVPASLGQVTAPAGQTAAHNTANLMGASQAMAPVLWNQVKVTSAELKQICSKHLTAVFLDWSNVTYNKSIDSGIQQEFNALGIRLLRITDSEFSPNGTQGDLEAVLQLKPDIILTGGTLDPGQMAGILAPAVAQHKIIVSWGVGSPQMKLGPNGTLNGLVAYDWYYLGEQMADAVHKAYPNGANLGYIHWVNDVDSILLREEGFLAGLKKYPNIHVITDGGPANPTQPNSGFTDPNGAEAYTEAFLHAHPDVNVLFAPWENPPGLGEMAAIKALGLQKKVSLVTMDLAETGAASLRQNGVVKVDMAEDVYDGGRLMALLSGLAAIHASYPAFVNFPTFSATSNNVATAWNFMHGPQYPCPAADCG